MNSLEEINRAIGKLEQDASANGAGISELRRLMQLYSDRTSAQFDEQREDMSDVLRRLDLVAKDISIMMPVVQSTRKMQWFGAGILTALGASAGVAGKSAVQWLMGPAQ